MTGFGRGSALRKYTMFTVEVTSMNNRGLEINCSGTKQWAEMEVAFQRQARKWLKRGKLRISVEIACEGDSTMEEDRDMDAVGALSSRLEKLARSLNVPFSLDTGLLLAMLRCTRSEKPQLPSWDILQPLAELALERALIQLQEMRAIEGEALHKDLSVRLDSLSASLDSIRREAPKVVPHYREMLLKRIEQAQLSFDLDDERIVKEIALFADHCDISEEITRLDSHLLQIRGCLTASEPVGRKMEFLLQELHREIHTIGSKAKSLALTREVVAFKDELESIREQIQNIE